MSRKGTRGFSLLFALMLLFQTLLTSFAIPAQVIATGTAESIFTGIEITPKDSEQEAGGVPVDVEIFWSIKHIEVESGDAYSFQLPSSLIIQEDQEGDVVTEEDATVGVFSAMQGTVTVTFSEDVMEYQDAEGSIVFTAMEEVDVVANAEGNLSSSDGTEETEAEEGLSQASESTIQEEKNDDEEKIEEASEAAEAEATEITPAASLNDNLIADFRFILNPGSEDEREIPSAADVEINVDEINALKLIYGLVRPEDLVISDGDTYTIDLPEIFDQTLLNPQNITIEGEIVGSYIIENNQLIITFIDEVNNYNDVMMYVEITGLFNKEIFEYEDEIVIEVPYQEGTNFTVTIRAEREEYDGEDKKTAGEQYIIENGEKVPVTRNPEFIAWSVRVNDSMGTFENATVIDDLGENLEIVEDSFVVERIIRNYKNEEIGREKIEVTPTITATGFELYLGDIEDAYDITYTTRLIRPDGGGTHTINNNARIILDGEENGVTDSFDATWSGDIPALQKSGNLSTTHDDIVHWEVKYNYGHENIGADVILTDSLTHGEVLLNTIKIVEVKVDIDGNVTERLDEIEVHPFFDEDGNVILPGLDADGRAYEITFQSILPIGLNDEVVTNEIKDNFNNKDNASVTVNTIPTSGKVGEQKVDENGRTYIEWTLTMNTKKINVSLINLIDVFSGEHLEFDADDPSLYELYRDGVKVDSFSLENYTHEDGRIGFELNIDHAGPHTYKFVYRTYYTLKGMQEPDLANHAKLLFHGGEGPGIGDRIGADVKGPKAGIEKAGKYVLNDNGKQEIEWTITFNKSKILLEEPRIKDVFTSGNYEFIDGSLTMTKDGQPFTDFTFEKTEEGFTLTVDNEDTNAVYEIIYRTTADDKNNENHRNDVTLTWQGGEEPAHATVGKRHPGMNKSGKVTIHDDGSKTVNWTVNFNNNKHVIYDFELVDQNYPETVKVSDVKITIGDEDVSDEFDINYDTNSKFTVKAKDRLEAKVYQLTYTTTLSPEEEAQSVKNTADITYRGGTDSKTATIPSPTLGVQKQAVGQVDKTEHGDFINWKIIANTDTNNHLVNLVNPVLTDDIPEDQRLVKGSIKVVRIMDNVDITDPDKIIEEDNRFEIKLPDGAFQYEVTFQTEILEFPSITGKIDRYTNKTTLTNDGYEPVSDDAYVDYFTGGENNNSVKTGAVNEETENIDWSLTVNPLGLTINNAEIVDTLGENHSLIDGTIRLIGEDGNALPSYDLFVAEDKRSFTVSLGQINQKIEVTYSTRLDPDLIGGYDVSNRAVFSGGKEQRELSTVTEETATSQWSYGGGGTGRTLEFTLNKVNASGEPVANATFQFVRVTATGQEATSGAMTITTEEDGAFKVENARAGRYIVTEVSVPSGYVKLTEPIYLIIGYASPEEKAETGSEYIIKVTDSYWNEIESNVVETDGNQLTIMNEHHPVSVQLEAMKVLEGNKELEEEQFTFELLEDGKVIDTKTNDAKGNVTFKSLTFDEAGTYEFQIREKAGSLKGVTYDERVYDVTVNVEVGRDGMLETEISYGNEIPEFVNHYEAEPVSVQIKAKKILEGLELTEGRFKFVLEDSMGNVVGEATNDADGNIVFDKITYTMIGIHNYVLREVITNDDDGITYDEKEYFIRVDVEDDLAGKLVAIEKYLNGPAVFTNTYEPAPDSVVFTATKVLNGQPLKDEQFEFELVDEDGNVLQTKKNNATGQVTFDVISFEKVGEYTYYIREVQGDLGGVEYDSSVFEFKVIVEDDNQGQLTAEVIDVNGPAVFTNVYTTEPGSAVIEAHKILSGQELRDGQFEFELIEEGTEKVLQTVTNNSRGQIIFNEISYDDPGTYEYIVREVEGSQTGVTYDDTEFKVIVEVIDNGKGNLEATVKYVDGPVEFKNSYAPLADSIVLEAKKVLYGQEMVAGQFEFELVDESGEVIQTKANNADGQVIFDVIKYEVAGKYTYIIQEVPGTQGGMTYDTNKYTVVVDVVDVDGQLEATADSIGGSAVFENHYTAAPDSIVIEARKVLEGQDLRDGQFSFELLDETGNILQTVTNNANGQVIFNEITYDEVGEYTYTIREVVGVQGGVTYDSTEYEITVTVTDDGEGQLTATLNTAGEDLVFTNTYVPSPDKVVFEATKVLEGQDLRDGQFSFELLDETGNILQTVTNNANGQVIFDEITYDEVGEYTYTIREVEGTQGGVTYDPSEFTVVVTVIDDDEGQLMATEEYIDGKAEFTNKYSTASTEVQLTAKKILEGHYLDLEDNAYTFVVEDVDGNVVASGTNDADGVVQFGMMSFHDVGSYEFTIREIAGEDADIIYDETILQVIVDVTDNGEGQLVAEVNYAEEPVFVNVYEPRKVSVGDYVWFDANEDGLQDETDLPIKGVVLILEDAEGNPVVDVYGNPVGPTTTDENGYYIFENLPIDKTYVVKIDREASKDALKGLELTLEEAGDDRSIDSSTWTAISRHLTEDGEHDPTLDFGFVKVTEPEVEEDEAGEAGGVIDGREGDEEDEKEDESAVESDSKTEKDHVLPSTATNMYNMLAIGFILLTIAIFILLHQRRRSM